MHMSTVCFQNVFTSARCALDRSMSLHEEVGAQNADRMMDSCMSMERSMATRRVCHSFVWRTLSNSGAESNRAEISKSPTRIAQLAAAKNVKLF
jgi:hypothetical protein